MNNRDHQPFSRGHHLVDIIVLHVHDSDITHSITHKALLTTQSLVARKRSNPSHHLVGTLMYTSGIQIISNPLVTSTYYRKEKLCEHSPDEHSFPIFLKYWCLYTMGPLYHFKIFSKMTLKTQNEVSLPLLQD